MSSETIYIFGNPILEFDNLPIQLKPELEKIFPEYNFIITDPNENLKPDNKKLVIIDTIVGINEAIVLDNIDKIQDSPRYSMHDFDLGFNLKLLQKIGELEKVIIFGLPIKSKKKIILEQLVKLIQQTIC